MAGQTLHEFSYIPSDARMPKLAVALDSLLMAVRFQQLLFANEQVNLSERYEVTACSIERIKYRAGEKCVISYRLQIKPFGQENTEEQWFCARLFPTGTAEGRYRKALREPLSPPRFGDAVMYLAELDMVIWAFPNDRKIAGLPTLMATAAWKNSQLGEIVAATWGRATTITAHQFTLVHYVPEHTCTVRVDLTLQKPDRQIPNQVTLFGKAYYDEEGAESYRLMQRLWFSPICRRGNLRIAQPLAYDPAARLLWQLGLPGHTLLTYEVGSTLFAELLGEAARAVALLHAAALPCQRTTAQREWVELIGSRRDLVARVCPHLVSAVDTVVTALRCLVPPQSQEPVATLHGDLHLQNFFVDEAAAVGQRLALIDLDNLSTGSPWRDLGSFCASLYYRGLVDDVEPSTIRRTIDQFLASYAQHAPGR
ncbi:MAG: phosphotransferase [Caldilineaceae bacterium]